MPTIKTMRTRRIAGLTFRFLGKFVKKKNNDLRALLRPIHRARNEIVSIDCSFLVRKKAKPHFSVEGQCREEEGVERHSGRSSSSDFALGGICELLAYFIVEGKKPRPSQGQSVIVP